MTYTYQGVEYADAYFKLMGYHLEEVRIVDEVKYYKANLQLEVHTDDTKAHLLEVYIPKQVREDFLEAGNTLDSMYAWLKTLPEFAGAVDA